MRVLLTNIKLNARSGTEIVVRDLAFGLRAAGCEVVVYTPNPGGIAAEIIEAGVPVVSGLEQVETPPHVIHGHHHVETLAALHHFPGVPGIFLCHDATSWHDFPPVHPMLRAYVVVDFNCRERLMKDAFLAQEEVRVIGNAVDLNRFRPRSPLPNKPARAVVFSNYAKPDDTWLQAIQEACDAEGVGLEVIGAGVGRSCERPEAMLDAFDLVFGKGRCVMEALATGCAAIMCDFLGLGGMVTPENLEHALNWNCGARLLTREASVENLRAEIQRYDPTAVREVSGFVRQHRNLDQAVRSYLTLYEAVIQPSTEVAVFAARWQQRAQRQLMARQDAFLQLERPDVIQPPMARLKSTDLPDIHLRLLHHTGPFQTEIGGRVLLEVALQNESSVTLSSGGAMPLALCHHWRNGSTGEMLIFENPRTLLASPIEPGTEAQVKLRVVAPSEAGLYHLEITLVQEHVFWFDGLTSEFPVKVPVVVSDRTPG